MKKALITGISGQDGSYLSEFLLNKNYEVHGIIRRVALEDETHRLWRIRNIRDKIKLHSGSLESFPSLAKIINKVQPDEIYHLAAQSYVANSFEDEFSTLNTNINGTHYMLSSMRNFLLNQNSILRVLQRCLEKLWKHLKMKILNSILDPPTVSRKLQDLSSPEIIEAYNSFASTGILFNHESPRRGFEFVTRKISSSVAKIKNNLQKI